MKVILLAAGRGRRFGRRTAVTPKCLIPIGPHGENLLSRYLSSFRSLRLRDIVIVIGHEKEKIIRKCATLQRRVPACRTGRRRGRKKNPGLSIRFVTNPDYKKGSIVSLCSAESEMTDDCLVMDADVYFEARALKKLLRARRTSFLLDPRSKSTGEEMMVMAKDGRLMRVSKKADPKLKVVGEAVGFFKIKKDDARQLAQILRKMVHSGKTGVEYEESYNELMKKVKVGFEKITGFWTEMDFDKDLKKIKRHRANPSS